MKIGEFDVDLAIKDLGICSHQKVECEKCQIGNLIFREHFKERPSDLCDSNLVYLLAKLVELVTSILGSIKEEGSEDSSDAPPKFMPGEKVTYIPDVGLVEHGVVKRVADSRSTFVVYNCGGNWENYEDYTAAKTSNNDLVLGWKEVEGVRR